MNKTQEEAWLKLLNAICKWEKRMKRVYIASPYSLGDQAKNVRRQIDCADKLMYLGFVPYAPLMSHFHHLVYPHPIEDWYKLDNEWVRACHYLLRLSGKSKGADDEVALAEELGIPVFYSIGELFMYDNVANGGN